MIELSFLSVEITFTVIWLMVRVIFWVRHGSIDWLHEALLLLMYVNFAIIIRFVFFPRALVDGHIQPLVFDPATAFPFRVHLTPFVEMFIYFHTLKDIAWNVGGNMALFIPTGILLPIVYKKLDNFVKVVAAGACISLCIEILQLPFASRGSDIDDIILNTLGVAIGYGIYAIIRRIVGHRPARRGTHFRTV